MTKLASLQPSDFTVSLPIFPFTTSLVLCIFTFHVHSFVMFCVLTLPWFYPLGWPIYCEGCVLSLNKCNPIYPLSNLVSYFHGFIYKLHSCTKLQRLSTKTWNPLPLILFRLSFSFGAIKTLTKIFDNMWHHKPYWVINVYHICAHGIFSVFQCSLQLLFCGFPWHGIRSVCSTETQRQNHPRNQSCE